MCSLIIFCACASQSQNTQTANEPNLDKLKSECEKSNAKSCYDLGDYLVGESQWGRDEKEKPFDDKILNLAKNYLLKSCNLNYADGCFSYSMSLMFSGLNELNSVEKENEKLAYQKLSKYLPTLVKYNQKACDLGSVNGCDELGSAYWSGEGVKKDRKMAFTYFKKSCDLAQSHKKIVGSLNKNIARAEASCGKVGRIYYSGEAGINKNKQLALEYFYKTCEFSIGSFECGMNVERFYKKEDYEFAFKLAQNGCEVGDKTSCNYLGILYAEGKGVAKDLKKSFWTFYKLCHQNTTYGTIGMQEVGCYNLGLAYAQGKGVEQSYKLAFESFQKSCPDTDKESIGRKENGEILFRSGYSVGCAMVGEYYYNAKGIRQDYRKAMEYFGRACNMGEQSGCDNHKMMKQNPYAYGLRDEDFK